MRWDVPMKNEANVGYAGPIIPQSYTLIYTTGNRVQYFIVDFIVEILKLICGNDTLYNDITAK